MAKLDDPAEFLAGLTLDLVRISSPSGAEGPAAEFVEQFLRDHGPHARVSRRGSAVTARIGTGDPLLVLAGHLDTVPFNRNPEPAIRDDRVVGLGTTDMKGALAVMLALARIFRPDAGGAAGSLGLVFYDCEEVEFARNGLRPLFETEPWLGKADLALLLEPTDNTVELGCLGTLHARVTFSGKAAHSARPWTGKNAVHLAGPFITRLAGIPPREWKEGPAVFREVINITTAEGGKARNVIPDTFALNVNFRFAPDRTGEEAESHLRTLVPEGASVEITDVAPAARPRADAPLLGRFLKSGGMESRAKQAWTDVAQFSERGVPAANYGPGIPELAHQREEYVPIRNLVECYETLAGFLGSKEDG